MNKTCGLCDTERCICGEYQRRADAVAFLDKLPLRKRDINDLMAQAAQPIKPPTDRELRE